MENPEASVYCLGCGVKMADSPKEGAQATFTQQALFTQKSPELAAILNFILPGIGYWYWGYKKVLGISPVLLFVIIIVVDYFAWNYLFFLYFLPNVIPFAIAVFLAYDLYVKTKGQKGWVEASM